MVVVPVLPVSKRRIFLLAAIVTVLALASLTILFLGVATAGPPRGGLTRTQAIQAAWAHADTGAIGVESSEVRQDFNTGFDLPVHRWVWVVTFYGHWELLCQGPCDRTTEWVAIDYSTGEWIASQYSYPTHR